MAIRVVVAITAAEGKGDELAASTGANLPIVRQEPGCEEYSLFRNVEDGDRFVMVERWATQADLDTHLAAARARQTAAPAPAAALRAAAPVIETFELP